MTDEVSHNEISPEIVSEARAQGWVPKDEFRGPENAWVDADIFVEKGRQINPILRKNNETLLKKIHEKDAELAEIKQSVEEFKKFQQESFERKISEYKTQIDQLRAAKKDAITQGDGDRVVAIDDAIDELREQEREARQELKAKKEEPQRPVEQSSNEPAPELVSWMAKNQWFGNDVEATELTNALGLAVRRKYPTLTGQAFLDKLDEAIDERIPDVRGKSKRQAANQVESSGNGAPSNVRGKKQSYDNLPPDAKAACDRYVKQGLIKSKEEYVAMYDWSE